MSKSSNFFTIFFCLPLAAQTTAQTQLASEMARVIERLDSLEKENAALRAEVKTLREEMTSLNPAPPGVPVTERLDIAERRVEEQASSKVEAAQKFPVRLTGMALFNAFHAGRAGGGNDIITTAALAEGRRAGGGSLRQSIVGLEYHGPQTVWGGKASGSLAFDFYNGGVENVLSNFARLRTGEIALAWTRRTVSVSLDKPLFSPRDPATLATVGISPLTGAGNLWRWAPQVRYEERFGGFRAQLGVYQTAEDSVLVSGPLERRRPALQGRFGFEREFDGGRKAEIAAAFSRSTSHAGATPVGAYVLSTDWLLAPARWLEFSGTVFRGDNVGVYGALRQGIAQPSGATARAVSTIGGWAQIRVPVTGRLAFHFYGGVHDDRNRQLFAGQIARNAAGAANFIYRLAPNVLLSLEAMRIRTQYFPSARRQLNRYDLALAYLF